MISSLYTGLIAPPTTYLNGIIGENAYAGPQLTSLPPKALRQYMTLNGMLIFLLERFPHLGDKIEWEDWRFEVVDMDGHHADKILASKIK